MVMIMARMCCCLAHINEKLLVIKNWISLCQAIFQIFSYQGWFTKVLKHF